MTEGNPPPDKPEPYVPLVRGTIVALMTFGITIGVMTALSDANGTVVTLLGLLFALVGGSFVSLYKAGKVTPVQREGALRSAGVLCTGILIGLAIGFFAKFAERKWFPTQKENVLTLVQFPTTEKSDDKNHSGEQGPVIVLHANDTTKLLALRMALRVELVDDTVPEQEKQVLTALSNAIDDKNFQAAVSAAAKLNEAPSSHLNSAFKDAFQEVFGTPLHAQ